MADVSQSDNGRDHARVSERELKALVDEELSDRELLSLLDANVAIPINAAIAANVLSDDSGAFAVSDEDLDLDQAM